MSAIVTISEAAQALKAQGKSVINLCLGEPDFNSPPHAATAVERAILDKDTKYPATAGTKALKQAVIQKLARENGLQASEAELMIGNGAKQLLFNAFFATLNTGDEVIIPAPYWSSYLDMVRVVGGVSCVVPCSEDFGFKLSPELLEKNINVHTRWLLLNSPSNPTGAMYSKQELLALAEVLVKHPHVAVISDEIYEHITYENPFYSFSSVAPELRSRTLLINGVSKAYAMTGWRVGYGFGPSSLIAAMTSVQNYSTSGVASLCQAGAVAALCGDQSMLHERREAYRARRDSVLAQINNIPGLQALAPEGAFYLFVNCHGLIGSKTPEGQWINGDEDFCEYLIHQALVAVVPGSAFGAKGYFRLSFACELAQLETACKAISSACSKLVK